MTMSGRPITGMLRLNTQSNQTGKTMENALKTARTAATARPVTGATGRFVRLGTVSSNSSFQVIGRSQMNTEVQRATLPIVVTTETLAVQTILRQMKILLNVT